MKIAVMGAGGMGGWLGARLASSNTEVYFIARGKHLQALQENGLKVSGADSIYLPQVNATENPDDIGQVDAVLFCVKLYDTNTAANMLAPLLGPETFVVTVQNGVESASKISQIIGNDRTLSGAAYFPANITAPGEINFVGRVEGKPHVALGEPGGGSSERANAFAKLCRAADIDVDVVENTEAMIWEKFCLVAATSAATAVTRQTFGEVRSDPDMRWLLVQAIAETAQIARKLGVDIDNDIEARTLDFIDNNPAEAKASQLTDLEHGRRLELEGLSGTLVRLGRQTGISTPVHATVYAALKPFMKGV